jgi:hypothetical protein
MEAMRKTNILLVLVAMFCGGCAADYLNKLLGDSTLKVVVSPNTQTVIVSAQQQFTAKVTGTSSQNVEWSIGGTQCVGMTDCGTITAAGLFTAPATVPNPAEITVTATAKANTKYSGSAVVTVTSAPITSSAIKGDYTFLLNGSDAEGRFSMAGSFVADGAGNLHAGELRICREQNCVDQSFAGTTSPSTKETGSFKTDLLSGTIFSYAAGSNGLWKLKASGTNGMRADGIMNTAAE